MSRRMRMAVVALSFLASTAPVRISAAQEPVQDLRIDPLLLVSVKEYRHILETIGQQIYPGWFWKSVPLLLYRPRIQDVLLNAPHQPPGFARFTGRAPLADRIIYARNDSTVKEIDGQNTSMILDSMLVLVVADQYSRMREQMRGTLRQGSDSVTEKWLAEWGFIQSPYDEIGVLLHEAFHVHQHRLAPGKSANEQAVGGYPLLDPANNALVAVEARLLRDAVLAPTAVARRAKTEQFVAIRLLRRSSLDTASIAYENLNEFSEGTARYVELRFLQLGERLAPVPEMYLHTGFTGYRGVLSRILKRKLDDMVAVASFSDNRFGNKFGGGPMRFRLYDTGGAQAVLLDEFAPEWKQKVFAPGVYLTNLLANALRLPDDRRNALVAQAKSEYGYDSIFVNRQALEREGRRLIDQRVDEILKNSQTLVTIDYQAAGDINGMAYTPFGVTAVNHHTAIYDLVPLAIRFGNRVVLRHKSVIPTIVDRERHTVTFAVASAAAMFEGKGAGGIDVPEFSLSPSPATTVTISGNKVNIVLR